jgi:hypothetical protein
MQQSAAIELDNLREAEEDEEVSHDAPDSFPGLGNDTVESSSTHNNTAQNDDGEKAAKVHSQISLAAAKLIATWTGAAMGFGALAVAVYYGYWSLRLQRWTAIKDFKEQCQGAMVETILSCRRNTGSLTRTVGEQCVDDRLYRSTLKSPCSTTNAEEPGSKDVQLRHLPGWLQPDVWTPPLPFQPFCPKRP